MKKIIYLFAATLVLAAVGCSKDDAASTDVQYVSELKIGIEGDTRLDYTSDATKGLKFSFEDGEMIRVYKKGDYNTDYLDFEYDASAQAFKGLNLDDVMVVGEQYTALYGMNINFVSADQIDGSFGQNADITRIPMVSDTFTATAGASIATMHHLVGVIEIPVKAQTDGKKLAYIEVNMWGDQSKKLSGDFRIFQSAPLTIVPIDGVAYNAKNLTFNTPVTLSASAATSLYMPVFPCSEGIVQIDYKWEDDAADRTLSYFDEKTLTVERGEITKIKEVVLP